MEHVMNYTDPHIYLFDEDAWGIYIMDDFGNAVRIPSRFWSNPPIWSL